MSLLSGPFRYVGGAAPSVCEKSGDPAAAFCMTKLTFLDSYLQNNGCHKCQP